MTEKEGHISNGGFEKESSEFLSKMEIPWEKDKSEIWDMLSEKIDTPAPVEVKTVKMQWVRYAVAASVILLIGVASFLRFYTTSVTTLPGQQLSAMLPDGSEVQLNAKSTLKYKPYWFKRERTVAFAGEGYFQITSGDKFMVKSKTGITTVLGTSFTIYSRKDKYTVTCLTGSVEVKSKSTKNNVVLKPNNRATVLKTGKIARQDEVNTKESTAWLDKEFFYTASPLHHVFYEISLRYNVSIDIDPKVLKSKRMYTGQFQETKSVEEVLDIVTKPLGLKYIKEEKNKYRIIQNN